MLIREFPGRSKDPRRAEGGPLATGYMVGNVAIDAPEGVQYENARIILLTHEHCDHIAGLNCSNIPYAASHFAADAIMQKREEATLCSHLGLRAPDRAPAGILKGGQILKGSGFSIEVIETPGHSEGSLCFYCVEEKALFSGDTVFGDYCLPALALPTSSPKKLLKSYEKLLKYEIKVICPGHGGKFPAENYIEGLISRMEALTLF
ncbi:MAG: MBL fold metallo-hydrolase [Candidatus Bilamarchaeaceae archaeon]